MAKMISDSVCRERSCLTGVVQEQVTVAFASTSSRQTWPNERVKSLNTEFSLHNEMEALGYFLSPFLLKESLEISSCHWSPFYFLYYFSKKKNQFSVLELFSKTAL